MLRLSILGGASLLDEGRTVQRITAQRRRLALLCITALEWRKGIARSKVATLLWPDADDERARHALSQLVYLVRTELGSENVFSGNAELSFPADIISADVIDFERAIEAGDFETAVTLYSGPLLDGVELGESVEMERWIESHRSRFASQASRALTTVARSSAANGDWKKAAELFCRLAELDPLDSQAAQTAMESLIKSGDRDAALRLGRQHEKLLRDELDESPPQSLLDLLVSARKTPSEPLISFTANNATPPAKTGTALSPTEFPARQPANVWRQILPITASRWWIAAAVVVIALGVAGFSLRLSTINRGQPASPRRVAVLPFAIHGDKSISFLREGLVDLLANDLDIGGYITPVSSRLSISAAEKSAGDGEGRTFSPDAAGRIASTVGADLYVTGEAVSTGNQLLLSASLYNRDDPLHAIVAASEEGKKDELFQIVNRLALQLLAKSIGGFAARFEKEAVSSGKPLEAVRQYLLGESEFRRGHYAEAVGKFRAAVDADSTFALAYYRLCISLDWMGAPFSDRFDAIEHSLKNAASLAPRERVMLEALRFQMRGDIEQSYSLYQSILAQYPDDAVAWTQLAELEFHYNQLRGHSFTESRVPFERVFALTGEPGALLHLARIAAWSGDRSKADSLLAEYYAARPDDRDPETNLFRAVVLNSPETRDTLLRLMSRMGADTIVGTAWRLAQFTPDLNTADRLLASLTSRERKVGDRRIGYQFRATLAGIAGNWKSASALLDSLRPIDPLRAMVTAATIASAPGISVPRNELLALRDIFLDSATSGLPIHLDQFFTIDPLKTSQLRTLMAGMLSFKLGDANAVMAAGSALASSARGNTLDDSIVVSQARGFTATQLHMLGNDAGASSIIDDLTSPGRGTARNLPLNLRFLAGIIQVRSDPEEANRWLSSFDGGFWNDLLYAPAANRMRRTFALAQNSR